MAADFATIAEVVDAARTRLPGQIWDYLCGGAGSEASLRGNVEALERIALLPRVMRDVRKLDTGAELFGHRLSLPVFNAPIGSLDLLDEGGAGASAAAAHSVGTVSMVSLLSRPGFQEIAAASAGPLMLQIYLRGDHVWLADIVARAERAGFIGFVLTVDTAVYARRDRDLANRYVARRAVDRTAGISGEEVVQRLTQAGMTWADFSALRAMTKLPLVIKGVLHPEDALKAVELGADAVYLSNHGGRQLDHAVSAIDRLPVICAVIGGRVPVLVDGGFMRGADVAKAIAFGATAVGIGKLQGMALAAGGREGVVRAFELMGTELKDTMGLLGATALRELVPEMLVRR